ncbi:hypothetical protein LEP1GSC107_1854 [Leptospira interrogans serovar Grippotyphosa str. UI 12769]|nr:hypothetical protein LEP1GSC014_1566 [Leptospira interrogans serovar Pomona str. Pomona]EKP87402.1 hypothetical protein LEP1GSC020_1877 [Leptospira interrogans serovar Grippotyphosa str. 2006006986]EKR37567.1 hypothetical protein LEP1GSC096_1417 [Leptospira interrogans serovar Hebdomadis str. R499]EKR44050.1 hypothetical protein LEP1GSC097_1419 [Leptospira interrogans serovar Grippotyphosa str. UI 08368]EMF32315.1 hypothetical protein LEP1GSC201_3287 [Leptospira interrogans serovar Pomona st
MWIDFPEVRDLMLCIDSNFFCAQKNKNRFKNSKKYFFGKFKLN